MIQREALRKLARIRALLLEQHKKTIANWFLGHNQLINLEGRLLKIDNPGEG
jgi:hypothetical protein